MPDTLANRGQSSAELCAEIERLRGEMAALTPGDAVIYDLRDRFYRLNQDLIFLRRNRRRPTTGHYEPIRE